MSAVRSFLVLPLLVSFCISGVFLQNQRIGEECLLSNGVGSCQAINVCPYAQNLLRKQQRPELCGFRGREPIVCCLGRVRPLNARKADDQCEDYKKYSIQAIAGGTVALSQEFRHMAALGYGDENNIQWLCGGSLISLTYVLTAAHCLESRLFGRVRWVRLGDVDLKSDNDNTEPQQHQVAAAVAYPDYRPPLHYHDIALLRLASPATPSLYVRPACLYTGAWPPGGTPEATGWGNTAYTGPTSPQLLKVTLALVDQRRCSQAYASQPTRRLPQGITAQEFCAGGVKGKDTCPGDSGGPLQINSLDHNNHVIIGVTAFGKPCAISSSPGVYMKITSYLDWIESIVWP